MSYCGIPGKFIHMISTPISFSMSRLFNNLFEMGHFPDIWKIAHVTAIYKRSGPKTDKSSFRPPGTFVINTYETIGKFGH